MQVTLKRHPLKFYLAQAFGFLFIFSLGIYLSWQSAEAINSTAVKRSNYLMFSAGIALILLACYTVFRYFLNTPIITLDAFDIDFNKQKSYKLVDIDEVKFTGKVPFPMFLSFPMEGTAIHFKNGDTKYIYDDLYSNTWKFKSLLDQLVNNNIPGNVEKNDIDTVFPEINDFELFKGNPVFSFRGLLLWGLVGIMIFLTFFGGKAIDHKVTMFFFGISAFWFLGISNSMNYFGLSGECFIVRNHNFIWKKHLYKISDIREIVFETYPKAAYCLRIISKNFHSKLYPAGTLHNKHWLELMRKLEVKGITVRNELNLE